MKEIKDDEKALADAFFECCDYRVSCVQIGEHQDRRLPQIPGPIVPRHGLLSPER